MSASADRNLSSISGGGTTASRSASSQPSNHNIGGTSTASTASAAAFHPHLRLLSDLSGSGSPGPHSVTAGAPLVGSTLTAAALSSFLRPPSTHPQLHQRHTGFLPTAGPVNAVPGAPMSPAVTRDNNNSVAGIGAAVIRSPMAASSVGAAGGRDNRLEFYPHLVGFGGANVGLAGNHLSSPAAAAAAVAAAYLGSGSGSQQQSSPPTVSAILSSQTGVGTTTPNQQNASATPFTPYHRLKVEDALSYLDQVKMQFGNRQHIYNDFLDIMKDFKSQAIDTPGVIQRVSQLFRGHPNLIVGFNTFLPPGYKIEVHGECGERVSICTPSGQSHIIAGDDFSSLASTRLPPNSTSGTSTVDGRGAGGTSNLANGPNANKVTGVQPLEFNHAINYVNKIKTRFQNQPEVYKQFLEILHTYQKEQRDIKEGVVWPAGTRPLTEAEVYGMVARLFANEEDLLREFGQFLPDASAATAQMHVQQLQPPQHQHIQQQSPSTLSVVPVVQIPAPSAAATRPVAIPAARLVSPPPTAHSKAPIHLLTASIALPPATPPRNQFGMLEPVKRRSRSPSPSNSGTPTKKYRTSFSLMYDISASEAARFGTLSEYQFFDKVRKALKEDEVYENFLRCLVLYNQELVSKSEILQLVQPFLGKFPELLKWLRDFLGCNELTGYVEIIPPRAAAQERISSDLALEIDYASCKRYGVSYRALPKSYVQPKCSGRTQLCDEVLNDTWVSFPSWQSEDSFVSSKKTQYEEFVYRTEDERFELDIVIETNKSTVQVLESVQTQMARMAPDEAKRFRLDDSLGGTSDHLHQRAVRRIYGDKAGDIIDGLKRNPLVAVPLVLKRMKAKDEEWREAQKGFNRIWRDQNEKYYWKSLDHQGLNFKQNDLKIIRSKALINQIETLYDERHEMIEDGVTPVPMGPHMEIVYPEERSAFYDVSDLLIHHVKRQSMQKEEKNKIKKILKVVLPELFGLETVELSDEDEEDGGDDTDERCSNDGDGELASQREQKRLNGGGAKTRAAAKTEAETALVDSSTVKASNGAASKFISRRPERHGKSSCGYSLIFFPNPWFVFLRLHQLLCERLAKLRGHAFQLISEQRFLVNDMEEVSAADALRCRPKDATLTFLAPCSPSEYYPMLLQLIKNVLDGQIDNIQYEDSLRDMFTIHAYLAFTMDRMVQTMVKQLQAMVSEELCVKSMALYEKWSSAGGAGGLAYDSVNRRDNEEAYQRDSELLMLDQNCFKSYFFHDECRITFELLNTDSDSDESPDAMEKANRWTSYIQDYIGSFPDGLIPEQFLEALAAKPVFLNRNIRQVKRSFGAGVAQSAPRPETIDNEVTMGQETGDADQPSTSGVQTATGFNVLEYARALKDVRLYENLQAHINRSPDQHVASVNKFRYVAGSEDYFCRSGCIQKGRTCRLRLTEARNRKFTFWHDRWILANVSMDQARITGDWFMGRAENMQLASVWMQRISEVCATRPPMFCINKYLVDKSQNPATFGLSQPSTTPASIVGVSTPSSMCSASSTSTSR